MFELIKSNLVCSQLDKKHGSVKKNSIKKYAYEDEYNNMNESICLPYFLRFVVSSLIVIYIIFQNISLADNSLIESGLELIRVYPRNLSEIDEHVHPNLRNTLTSENSDLETTLNSSVLDSFEENNTDENVLSSTDEDVVDNTDEVVVDTTDEDVVDNTDEVVLDNTDEDVLDSIDEDVLDNTDEAVLDNNDEDVVDNTDEVVLDNTDEDVLDNIDEDVLDDIDEDVLDNIDEDVLDDIDEDVLDNTDEAVLDNNDEDVVDNIDEAVLDNIDEDVLDNTDEAVLDNTDEAVLDNNDEAVLDNNDEDVVDNIDEAVLDNIDEDVLDNTIEDVQNDKLEDENNVDDSIEGNLNTINESVMENPNVNETWDDVSINGLDELLNSMEDNPSVSNVINIWQYLFEFVRNYFFTTLLDLYLNYTEKKEIYDSDEEDAVEYWNESISPFLNALTDFEAETHENFLKLISEEPLNKEDVVNFFTSYQFNYHKLKNNLTALMEEKFNDIDSFEFWDEIK
uniref:Coiled-coil domain-containing protein 1-like n=1 Tax=Piliocolobus tephrosceles TaxID=591936 RepID=A0A8C9GSV9_9PRIM